MPLDPFHPDFTLIKAGIFSKTGNLKEVLSREELKETCSENPHFEVWVTHRLSKGETWEEKAGTLLGKSLKKQLEGTCVRAVELNAEPLPDVPDWFLKFLSNVKKEAGNLSIRLAVHALSEKKLEGPTWNKALVEKLLPSVDGVDLMMYDTGLKEKESYSELLVNAFKEVEAWAKGHPAKTFVIGVPAYYDKTRLHRSDVENLKSVLFALSRHQPNEKAPWCNRQIRFAIYAGWTMTAEDKTITQLLRAWRANLCESSTKSGS